MSQHNSGSTRNEKKRRLELDSSNENISQSVDSWSRFLVIEASDHEQLKLNPFAVSKAISGICSTFKNVSRLRSGSLLVECDRKQQSVKLLSVTSFANVEVVVSPYRTLKSCRGIIRDRARCLSEMSEQEITDELEDQGVNSVKRFTKKIDGTIKSTNTYLVTFASSSLPRSIKAGYFNIGVEVYIPNPLRCYNCQQFGHGFKSCRSTAVCHRCGDHHVALDCQNDIKCINCGSGDVVSSKSCPKWQQEFETVKLKCQNNISFSEAKQLYANQTKTHSAITYSAAVTTSAATASIMCQTESTWINSDQPLRITTKLNQTKITSETQTSQSADQPNQGVKQDAPKKRKERKQHNKQLKAGNSSSSDIAIHNTFTPLDMEVTASSQERGRSGSSSHTRTRSPIEPP